MPADLATAGDLGPEASVFVAGEDSPTGKPMLVLGNEVSGTTALFELTPLRQLALSSYPYHPEGATQKQAWRVGAATAPG